MVNYESIEEILSSTNNLVKIIDNQGQDDNTVKIEGVDWFSFNDRVANDIYISGNSWIGFGTSTEQLKICRRDAKLYTLSREVGTLYNHYQFIRIKWEGYAQYNNTSISAELKYEILLLDNGDVFIHIIKAPTNSSYMGTSSLACSTGTKSISLSAGVTNLYVSFKKIENVNDYELSYEILDIEKPKNRKYLISDANEDVYSLNINSELIIVGKISDLSAQLFLDYGISDLIDSSHLIGLNNPSVYCWQEELEDVPILNMKINATPTNQVVISENIVVNDSRIIGIENVVINSDESTLFEVSFDNGNTYKIFNQGVWINSIGTGMTKLEINSISSASWNEVFSSRQIKFRFILTSQSEVNSIVINYINEEV